MSWLAPPRAYSDLDAMICVGVGNDASPSIIPEGAMANGAKSPPTIISK